MDQLDLPSTVAEVQGATATPLIERGEGGEARASDVASKDLKRRTTLGALVFTGAKALTFVLRTASLMILARLLLKEDFGLLNMVTAITGFLGLLRDAGLSMATVQRVSITKVQTSTLFWINLAMGGLFALLIAVAAPILAAFYGEPRLFWLTIALGTTFVFHGASAQHSAMLQRSMRFLVLATIDIASLLLGIAAGIGMAVAGYGYWALAAMTISGPALYALGTWVATGWIPGLPRRRSGIRSMLAFGGAVTLNNVIVYLAYNVDKVLIGRFWGAEALGIYGRAYQLINLPTENLNSTMGLVAFPALSRIQNDPTRLRDYFLKGYGLFLSLVLPITMACALFADDIILVFLGPAWHEVAPLFRLLAPTICAFAFANPFYWLMLAAGRASRCLSIALVVTPALMLSYAVALKYGPSAVALGFSVTMMLAVVPVQFAARQGTLITMRDLLGTATPPSISMAIGAVGALATRPLVGYVEPALARLFVESTIMFCTYAFTLLFIMKQSPVYVGLLREIGLLGRFAGARLRAT